jgi:starch synthase
MVRAWEGFRYKEKWQELQQRGMKQDFSWYNPAAKYLNVYREVLGETPELTTEEAEKIELLKQLNQL